MRKQLRGCVFIKQLALPGLLAVWTATLSAGTAMDLVPAGRLKAERDGRMLDVQTPAALRPASAFEVEWDEERDVQEIRVGFDGPVEHIKKVEYWFKNWPYNPPEMPSMEDPLDDPWQGEWLPVQTKENCDATSCRYTFGPLDTRENPRAKNLPGTPYRRTLKIRISYNGPQNSIRSIQAFSSTTQQARHISVQLGPYGGAGQQKIDGWFSAFNGEIRAAQLSGMGSGDGFDTKNRHWSFTNGSVAKKFRLDVVAGEPELPGSNDETVVTVHARMQPRKGTAGPGRDFSFSFKVRDLDEGAIVIPAIQARVTAMSAAATEHRTKATIRSRIPLEPEQTYERAKAEIPALDPVHREWGGPLYMPLAVDSSWQKFAFELGGDVFVSKTGLIAKPAELKRLGWKGDRLTWSVAIGEKAERPPAEQVVMKPEGGYLPIVSQRWAQDGIEWNEEAFATLLRGPLSPDDHGRSEETPAALLVRLTAHNAGAALRNTMVWLSTNADDPVTLSGDRLLAGQTLRAVVNGPNGTIASKPGGSSKAWKATLQLQPGASESIILKLPVVTDLTDTETRDFEALDYQSQRDVVEEYWRTLIGKAAQITVPEKTFNEFVRAAVAHIHLTAKKDPQTGLVMLGAASYVYDVYENESCYQILLLDALGRSQEAATLLKPMLELQGSENFPGAQTGSFAGVFHGVKISDSDDYTANGYGLDHGTVLWTLAQHYLYTRDREWFQNAWPHMQKAIEWIEEQRKATEILTPSGDRVREYGLLPASKLEDNNDWANWFAVNAFAYAGMDLTGQILSELGYSKAGEIRKEAAAYRDDIRRAVLRATAAAPVVRLQDGSYQPYVPTVPNRRFRLFGPARMNYYARYGNPDLKPLLRLGADRDTLCGTVLLLMLGVFDVNEPIAEWILNDWEDNETLSSGMGMNIHGMTDDRLWFSQGGMVFQANLINPIPVYLRRHEIPAAIRNLYNDFVACFYPGAGVFTEEFHQWVHASGPFYKSSDEARFVGRLRDMLVLEDKDSLWVAPGVPRRWLDSREGISLDKAQTFFGALTYTMRAGTQPRTIAANIELPQRNPAKHNWLVVRTPSRQIRSVKVNGRNWDKIDRAKEAISLDGASSPVAVEVEY